MTDPETSGMSGENFQVIDTAPVSHVYPGGLLCNLADPGSDQMADYLCGEMTWDGAVQRFNWYHWNGSTWVRTFISEDRAVAVGMDAVDITGNGKADLIAAEWPLGKNKEDGSGGHIFWFEQPENPFEHPWQRHVLAAGWDKAHDLHVGNFGSGNKPDVLVRLKDGKISWFEMPEDPRDLWVETVVAAKQAGDGTALYDVTGSGSLDVVTGHGFYENLNDDGKRWQFHPFNAARDLELDLETRVVAGDFLQDGSVTVVISESELLQHARLVLLHSADQGKTWDTHLLVDQDRDLGALHSLQILDVDLDGRPDLFVAEMELYKEDTGIQRRPTWKVFLNRGGMNFEERTVLDANLGAHQGRAGRISSPSRTDFICKNWQANSGNALDGINHIVHVVG
ncbi:MAG: hypothetical protein O2954_08595 [bacterium]|nr:hypothetical protein [bacterium]